MLNRPSREWEHIAGEGGSILLRQINAAGEIVPDSTYFDIRSYMLDHIYINANDRHSGINGGPSRIRTGSDWKYSAIVSAPVLNFVEMFLGSYRGVAMTFNMGDPSAWARLGIDQLTYRADKALLRRVRIINDAHTGEGIVMAEIEGEGSSILSGYVGDTPISAEFWP